MLNGLYSREKSYLVFDPAPNSYPKENEPPYPEEAPRGAQ
jgi:hypothetical protein